MFYMFLINVEWTRIFEGDCCGLLHGLALSAFVWYVREKPGGKVE